MINSIERNRKRTGRLIKELSKTYEFYGFELKSNKREQCQCEIKAYQLQRNEKRRYTDCWISCSCCNLVKLVG